MVNRTDVVDVEVGGEPLTLADLLAVAKHGAQVRLAPDVATRMQPSLDWVRDAVQPGPDGSVESIYSINTGFGSLAGRAEFQRPGMAAELSRRLVLSNASGVGRWLTADVVRAAMLIRLTSLTRGHSGVRPVLVELLADMLNRDVLPAVPEFGSLGRAGEPRRPRGCGDAGFCRRPHPRRLRRLAGAGARCNGGGAGSATGCGGGDHGHDHPHPRRHRRRAGGAGRCAAATDAHRRHDHLREQERLRPRPGRRAADPDRQPAAAGAGGPGRGVDLPRCPRDPPGGDGGRLRRHGLVAQIPEVAAGRLAEFCDVYCDSGYFDLHQTRRILEAGLANGLTPKLHLDAYSHTGAAELAIELGAVIVDHLNFTPERELALLADAGIVGVYMPCLDYAVAHPRPVLARQLVAAGMEIALATDICPGCWVTDMQLVIAMACRSGGLSVAQAVRAATHGAARSMGRADTIGSLVPGYQADLVVLDHPSHEHLAYQLGRNAVTTVVKSGRVVKEPRQ